MFLGFSIDAWLTEFILFTLAGKDAKVLDYGDNYIYPGFIESHSHGHLAGDRMIGQAHLMEAVTREQSLRAMTINVARQFRQEHRMGSIEFGKIANMAVFDTDFLHDDIEKVGRAKLIATVVDGEEVFKA